MPKTLLMPSGQIHASFSSSATSQALTSNPMDYVVSTRTSTVTLTTSGTAQNAVSSPLSLSSGLWAVFLHVWFNQNSSSWTKIECNINSSSTASTITIDSDYSNYCVRTIDSTVIEDTLSIPFYYIFLTASTSYYAKVRATWSGGTGAQFRCRFHAVKLT